MAKKPKISLRNLESHIYTDDDIIPPTKEKLDGEDYQDKALTQSSNDKISGHNSSQNDGNQL